VVLYFYPKDFTSGCTVEAHNFQRDLAQYDKANAAVIGVNLDSVDSHKGFCTKEGLNFKLLADPDHAVTSSYGSTHADRTCHGIPRYARDDKRVRRLTTPKRERRLIFSVSSGRGEGSSPINPGDRHPRQKERGQAGMIGPNLPIRGA